MTPQELKLSILRRAFQGKLVNQIFEEGTGADMLPIIQSECHNKIVTGQIKRFKVFPEITDEDIDFDVPDNWKLIRFGTICQLLDGEKRSGDAFPYLEARYLRGKTAPTIITEGKYIAEGTNVILVDGENSGEVFHIPEDGYMGSTFKVLFVPETLLLEYVVYFLQLHKNTLRNNKKGAAIPHLNKDIFFNLIFPLPPLAEQKRIVAKIEELLPLIDRYERAWSKLDDFNKRFPVDMQKSILQMAIQGKLVPQLSEEGTGEELFQQIQTEKQALIKAGKIKKEKPLPEIAEDEIPFDIPESWKWVHIGSLLHKLVDGAHRTPKYTTSGVPFVSVRNMSSGVLSLEDTKFISKEEHQELWNRCNPQRGDILLSKVGTTGVPAKVDTDTEFSLFVSVALLKFNNDLLDIDFLIYSILAPDFQKQCKEHTRGVGNKNWVIVDIANTMMPLPPLAEQKRIVAKLKEILPLCERLK